ncbi:exodeoxyribonuclease I [Aliagarivorans marinus]|uniref:exodeoxyribonuclease I n=1 Tax=Aliagarivorans marinus TaxID=561965 RepID=UPI00041A4AB6|nr:exodeoxyribonuclease I [Aliagarivorans marinus]
MTLQSFLFHDYETFGTHPGLDRPCQFAAIRTDADLNPIGKPMEWFCQPPNDYMPHPGACLVTGISPQIAMSKGLVEAEFINKVNQAFSEPGTCGVGYNSIRFDDEVTRYTLYRNFFDPYAREWQQGNSRWDVIDLVRACYALRPEGIEWPENEDGLPSFRLELLTAANELGHANAHDALSDVQATIDLAKLLKKAQPRLFDFYLELRNKRKVAEQFDLINFKPIVHVSGMFGAAQGCVSWMLPLAWHPQNSNAMMAVDLNQDAQVLLDLSPEQLHERLYTPRAELEEGQSRVPVKLIHSNKSPFVAPAKSLTPDRAEALGVSAQQCRQSLNLLTPHAAEVREKLIAMYAIEREFNDDDNPDTALYRGFVGNADKKLMELVRSSDPQLITREQFQFDDARLNRLLLRYKGRNYPELLNESELREWQSHREHSLQQQASKVLPELEQLSLEHANDQKKMTILKQVYQYIQQL